MSDHTSSSAPAGATPGRPQAAPGQGFFDWIRKLGVSRGDAWIGGVCGGLGARFGIDPVIVRGIAVVVALLGGPAFLLYALAWLLLPDTAGTIHLERLVRGVFEAGTVGVAVFVLLAFLPVAQGVWWAAGWPFGVSVGWPESLGKLFWSILVIAAIVFVVVWASRRAGGWGAFAGPTVPGSEGAQDREAPGAATSGPFAAAPFAAGPFAAPPTATAASATTPTTPTATPTPTTAAPTAPPPPAPDASASVLDEWRERQAEWRLRYDEWKRQQADVSRVAREQRWAENARRQAEALERARLRRLSHPRTSGSFIAIALGVALIVGALTTSYAWSDPELSGYQGAFGCAAATAVVGLSMVVAGILRRRSGFLAFVAIVLTVVTVLLTSGALTHVTYTGGLVPFTFTL